MKTVDIFDDIASLKKQGKPFVLATVVQSLGSAPRVAGARMLVFKDGRITGTVGGGNLENTVMDEALQLFDAPQTKLLQYDLGDDLQMSCGGKVTVYLEPFLSSAKLFIFGAGHIGAVLTNMAATLGFRVTVIDNRPDFADAQRLPSADHVLADEYSAAIEALPFDEDTYVVIVTYKHAHDHDILDAVTKKPYKYLGMIGSKTKVTKSFNLLRDDGVPEDIISGIHAPIGLDIGADTPEEIAVSIAAELVAVRAGKKNSG